VAARTMARGAWPAKQRDDLAGVARRTPVGVATCRRQGQWSGWWPDWQAGREARIFFP
jgi:hypothetical protein